MSRRTIGSRIGPLDTQQIWKNRRNQDTMVQMAGGIEAAEERIAGPYKPYVPPYIWNSKSGRYHWREDGPKGEKKTRKGSFYPVPDITRERQLYAERIARRKESRERAKGGSRLKKRS